MVAIYTKPSPPGKAGWSGVNFETTVRNYGDLGYGDGLYGGAVVIVVPIPTSPGAAKVNRI